MILLQQSMFRTQKDLECGKRVKDYMAGCIVDIDTLHWSECLVYTNIVISLTFPPTIWHCVQCTLCTTKNTLCVFGSFWNAHKHNEFKAFNKIVSLHCAGRCSSTWNVSCLDCFLSLFCCFSFEKSISSTQLIPPCKCLHCRETQVISLEPIFSCSASFFWCYLLLLKMSLEFLLFHFITKYSII